jgi:hypothetical protein
MVYRKASDGLIYLAGGATNDEKYKYIGMALVAAPIGQAVTAVHGCKVRYGSGMTLNTDVFLSSAVLGAIADANAVNQKRVGRVVAADTIQLFPLQP